MHRHVWIVVDMAEGRPGGTTLQERLSELDPIIRPYGGVQRRIRLTIDTNDALEAGRHALQKLSHALADWADMSSAYVDEVVLIEPVDPRWERLT